MNNELLKTNTNIIEKSIVIDVLKKVVNDDTYNSNDNFLDVINNLVKPFATKKQNKQSSVLLDDIFKKCGICVRCRVNKIKNSADHFCKNCKSVLKEDFKKNQ